MATEDEILFETEEHMDKAVEFLRQEFRTIRTGRASTAWVENLRVDYYGTQAPLKQLANLSAPDANVNGVPDVCETGCVLDCDDDGDGCLDDADSSPSDPMACGDSEGDGCDDCSGGSFDPATDGVNTDSDGSTFSTDRICRPRSLSSWEYPAMRPSCCSTSARPGALVRRTWSRAR